MSLPQLKRKRLFVDHAVQGAKLGQLEELAGPTRTPTQDEDDQE